MQKFSQLLISPLVLVVLLSAWSLETLVFAAPAYAAPGKVWTADEILAVRKLRFNNRKKVRYCQGGVFKPCVCPSSVTKLVQYRPAVAECNGKAAIIVSGKYTSAFSVVVRDRENKDRWPAQGFNGCTPYETDVLALNKCSAFKVQKILGIEDPVADAEVHCLGASGYSSLFRRVSRITIKLADVPDSHSDPLVRLCLSGPKDPLN